MNIFDEETIKISRSKSILSGFSTYRDIFIAIYCSNIVLICKIMLTLAEENDKIKMDKYLILYRWEGLT